MSSKKIFENVEPIRAGFSANLGIRYHPTLWNYYDIPNRNKTILVGVRKEITEDTLLWSGTTTNSKIEYYDEKFTLYIKIPASETSGWKYLDYVYFDLMIFNETNKWALPGLFKWPVVRRIITSEP